MTERPDPKRLHVVVIRRSLLPGRVSAYCTEPACKFEVRVVQDERQVLIEADRHAPNVDYDFVGSHDD